MKMKKRFLRSFPLLVCLLFLAQAQTFGADPDVIPVGSQLAPFTVGVPDSPEVQKYLGLKSKDPFKLADIDAKLVVIDFMSAL